MAWACMATSGKDSLILINDVTHDGGSKMNQVYKNILSANLQRNTSRLIRWNSTVQQDNDPKHTTNTTENFIREQSGTFQIGQINHQTLAELNSISPAEEGSERENP